MSLSKNRLLPYILLSSLTLIIYWQALSFDFIPSWDDKEYVIENLYIRGFSAENLKFIFTETFFANYAPLHILSYSVDFALWGFDPKGYHLTNIIIHGLNACLVYALIRMITGNSAASFIASLLFAAHPLNVENVAWVAERKTLLTSLFSFAAFISYLKFREAGKAAFYALSALFFILAVLSKPLTVTLPLALVAYELLVRKDRKGIAWTLPLFIVSALGAALAFYAHLSHKSIEEGALTIDILLGTVYPTMIPIYWKYVRLIAWPFGLSGFYDTALYGSFLSGAVLISLVSWIIVTAVILLKGTSQARFWYLWFWIWLLPVSNIIPLPVYYADRYMYLPAIGLFVMAGLFLSYLGSSKRAAYAAAAVTVAFYAAVAFGRAGVWKNEIAFWKDTAQKSPNQDKAHLNLGYAYEMAGMYEEAEKEYLAAIRIYPSPEALSNLEMVRMKKDFKFTPPGPAESEAGLSRDGPFIEMIK